MSVGKRVVEAIAKMEVGDAEGALFAICSAIDATATAEFGKSGRSTYKKFVHENLGLITDIGLRVRIENCNFMDFADPTGQMKANPDGSYPVQEIIYHMVRCGLYHDAKIPATIKFHPERIIANQGGVLQLPDALIHGMILAVVVAPVNSGENTGNDGITNFGDIQLLTNTLWGRRAELHWLLEARKMTFEKQTEEARRLGIDPH